MSLINIFTHMNIQTVQQHANLFSSSMYKFNTDTNKKSVNFRTIAKRRTLKTISKYSSNTNTRPNTVIASPQFAERLNGRLAMIGYVAGIGNQYITDMSFSDQLITNLPFVVLLSSVLGFATLKTRNVDLIEERPFTFNIELLNGRMAMLGLLFKFMYENLN